MSRHDTVLHLHDYLKGRELRRYYRLWLDEDGTIRWAPSEENRSWENLIDGKLILETTKTSLSPRRWSCITRGFRTQSAVFALSRVPSI
jgi:hypothetical protein